MNTPTPAPMSGMDHPRPSRRAVLGGLAASSVLAAGRVLGGDAPSASAALPCPAEPSYFPNVVLEAHDGRRALFYEHLLRDRVVLLHCFAATSALAEPALARLAEVRRLLGARAGRDVFLYSLTTDPERDTGRVLRETAARHVDGPGWLLLGGTPEATEAVRGRLFLAASSDSPGHAPGHRHGEPARGDCSLAMFRYGNVGLGLWGAVPMRAAATAIVERLGWVSPATSTSGATAAEPKPRRRGPAPLVSTRPAEPGFVPVARRS